MADTVIDWGGSVDREPTAAELDFATALAELVPALDYWLHADDDGTPWLLVSQDRVEGGAVRATLRLDFDGRGIRGGWSPSCLNWDDGMRAEEALIDLVGGDGLHRPAAASTPADLARHAADWFLSSKKGRWAVD